MSDPQTIADRLKLARIAAGFGTMSAAAEHFEWKTSTYAGHENGSRGIKNADLEKYAEAFGVRAGWLLTGKAERTAQPRASTPAQPGIAEAAVAPFHGRTDGERRAIIALAEQCNPRPRNPVLYRATRHIPGLSVLKGDVLVMDVRPTPREGQTVIVQVEHERGEVETHPGTFRGDSVSPIYGEQDYSGASAVTIMGTIALTLRLPSPA